MENEGGQWSLLDCFVSIVVYSQERKGKDMSSENLAVSDNLKEEKRSKSPEAKVCSVPKMNVVFNGGIDISGIVVIKVSS